MFAGHAALALVAKKKARSISLGVLIAATYGLDLIWPILVITGVERVAIDPGNTAFTPLDFQWYPWTHSLLLSLCWALVGGVATYLFLKSGKGALIVGALVFSHWFLDFLTHRPDLPLWPGDSPMAGLGLWRSVAGTLAVEGLLFLVCALVYIRSTRAIDRIGSIAMYAFLGFIFVLWVSGPFAPPPPSAKAVAIVGIACWLFPFWAAWFDRHREPID